MPNGQSTQTVSDASASPRSRVSGAAPQDAPVAKWMSSPLQTLRRDCRADEAAKRMLEHGIGGMPVVDDAGRPVGMLSQSDLLEPYKAAGADTTGPRSLCVDQLMAPFILAVGEHDPLSLALSLMAYEGVQRLLVLDEKKRMAGILTTSDVLRFLAQLGGLQVGRRTPRRRQVLSRKTK